MSDLDIKDIKKFAVIMAGGAGDNLWPKSNSGLPKGFNHFFGVGTMIQNTISRLKPLFDIDEIYVVTQQDFVNLIEEQVPELPHDHIIIEPFGKHTAPCLGLTASVLKNKVSDDTVMLAFPSDHVINNINEFHKSLESAIKFAYKTKTIVTLGITPTEPKSNFGYVQIREIKADLGDYYDMGVRYTSAFAEKPDLDTALRFIESGDFLWNSGIFVWRIDTFWKAFEQYLPEHFKHFESMQKLINKKFFLGIVEETYRKMSAESVDYAILEKAVNVFVVKSTFAWSDLNNWDEVHQLKMRDARNNFIEGQVIPINVENCYVSSKEKLIAAVDVKNLIIVEDENSIIVCNKENSDKISDVVDYLKRKHILPYI